MTAAQRQQLLFRFADLLEANAEYLASLTRRTLGAPYLAFGKGEIDTAIDCFRCE
jgi:acyl-CoA reductase-like NAD-dependent aldehyde dehydrogenase